MKATEQYFPVVLFITVPGDLTFDPLNNILSVTIQMKATEQYFQFGDVYYAV